MRGATRDGNRFWLTAPVHIHVDPGYAVTYAGQVATITVASLFGRMSATVSMDVPSKPILAPLPWVGETLNVVAMRTLRAADPYGCYEQRPPQTGDLRLVLGPDGDGLVVHGSGWGAYCGMEPSPVPQSYELNPFGAAFAVVAAASRLAQDMDTATIEPVLVDAYTWSTDLASSGWGDSNAPFRSRGAVVHRDRLRRKLCSLLPWPDHGGISRRPRRPRLRRGRECHALGLVYIAGWAR